MVTVQDQGRGGLFPDQAQEKGKITRIGVDGWRLADNEALDAQPLAQGARRACADEDDPPPQPPPGLAQGDHAHDVSAAQTPDTVGADD